MDDKEFINEVIDFIKHKVNNDACTMEELRSASDFMARYLNVIGTVEDMAKYFHVPESTIRTVISRKVIEKPKRRVFYNFMSVLKNVPSKWLKNK